MTLPRNHVLTLNTLELGYLTGLLIDRMDDLKKYAPALHTMLWIEINTVYTQSGGHPWQKQAVRDNKKLMKQLEKLLEKEETND